MSVTEQTAVLKIVDANKGVSRVTTYQEQEPLQESDREVGAGTDELLEAQHGPL